MRRRLGSLLGLISITTSCAITETANPAREIDAGSTELCVVEKTDVRQDFRSELERSLVRHGFQTRKVAAGSPNNACPVLLSYDAKYSWDFVTYMAWAEIVVFRNGRRAGDALYSAPRGGWSMTFRIYESTESKVETMIDQLFPAG